MAVFYIPFFVQIRSKLDLVVLQGDAGREMAVVSVIHGSSVPISQAAMLQPNLNGKQVKLFHEEASRNLRLHFLEMLSSNLPALSRTFTEVRMEADFLAGQVQKVFLDLTASNLPRYKLVIT
jgi:hypothetical protein